MGTHGPDVLASDYPRDLPECAICCWPIEVGALRASELGPVVAHLECVDAYRFERAETPAKDETDLEVRF
jgi:hypothetical protein